MNIEVTLNKAEIMPEVYKITGYTGAKNMDIEKISSTEDDLNILDSYFGEAVSSIADIVPDMGIYLMKQRKALPSALIYLPVGR